MNLFSPHWSIRSKISSGYAIALSIAVVGTSAGLAIGNYYQQQVRAEMLNSQRANQLLRSLQINILESRSHQHEMIALLRQPRELQTEYLHLEEDVTAVKTVLAELKAAPPSAPTKALEPLLPAYESTAEEYATAAKATIEQAIALAQEAEINLPLAQELLQNFISSPVALKFEYLSYRLKDVVEIAEQQQELADRALNRAERLRNQIVIVSMVLSVAIATLLAIYTSRAVAHPIAALTQLAQRVTEKGNFTLQAPVTTEDEVGKLAISLNQLIQWIAGYIKELEEARQTLEQRVEARTEELFHKNQQLEQAYQQLSQALQNLQETQSQLIQTEKMSSLGQMVAGVAHEINNPVNFIYGNLTFVEENFYNMLKLINLYQQHYPNPSVEIQTELETLEIDFLSEDLPKILGSIKMGAERIRKLVLSLRNFSRLDEAELKTTDIHEGIDSTLLILNHRLKSGIEVIKNYGDLPLIECYPAQLNQVFMNIINNAIDALLEGEVTQEEKQIFIQTEILQEHQVMVKIKDNGSGINPQIKNKVFEPFFTTKPVGKGTGLGLSICYQIMDKHQGQIFVESENGQGTEFTLILPVSIKN